MEKIIQYKQTVSGDWKTLDPNINTTQKWYDGIEKLLSCQPILEIDGCKYRSVDRSPEPLPNLTFDITVRNKHGHIISKMVEIPLTI